MHRGPAPAIAQTSITHLVGLVGAETLSFSGWSGAFADSSVGTGALPAHAAVVVHETRRKQGVADGT